MEADPGIRKENKTPPLSDVTRLQSFECLMSWVQDDPKLPDDGGEIPKSQRRGWRFDSRLLNFTKNLSNGQLSLVLWRWPINLPSQTNKQKLTVLGSRK
jgi:hypothetical protein